MRITFSRRSRAVDNLFTELDTQSYPSVSTINDPNMFSNLDRYWFIFNPNRPKHFRTREIELYNTYTRLLRE